MPNLLLAGLRAERTPVHQFPGAVASVLYIDVVGFSRIEQNHGPDISRQVVGVLADILQASLPTRTLPWPSAEFLQVWDDGFAVVIPHAVSMEAHGSLVHRFVRAVEAALNERMGPYGLADMRLRYGVASGDVSCGADPAECWYELITQAARIARRRTDALPIHMVEELQRILQARQVLMRYQPIRELATGALIGWECLARGPSGSELESPLVLFDCAERAGCLVELERLCRTQAIRNARVEPPRKLFINISPKLLSDPSFRQGETRSLIDEVGMSPDQIVFELTEHHAIREYPAFLQLVAHYRQQGYRIAIDDVGAGHSGLVTLMQVKPDYVKIDMELIRGLERDRTKQDIVRAIREISSGFAATVIAEGIETSEELACLRACGVDFGQGFLLGKPGMQPVSMAAQNA